MKRYLLTFVLALIIGFFLCNFFLNQYSDYNGISDIKVSNVGENIYFVQYGVFSTLDSLENNTINLQNYVYNKENNLYHVYVGITKLKSNAEKILEHYKKEGYDLIIKEYSITNSKFLELLNNYDEILKNTTDDIAISSVINQVLIKYEEVVINGS